MYRPNLLSFFGAVVTTMLLSFTVFAASLSDIRVSSGLSQNLLAEVTVLGVGERDQLSVSLAPDSVWLKTGISPLPELSGLRFSIKEGGGGQVITIVGKRPLREPVVEFILQVKTPQGTLQRWYTLLLDPPSEVQSAATVAQVAPPVVEIIQPVEPPVLAEPAAESLTAPVSKPTKFEPVITAAAKPRPRPVERTTARVAAPVINTAQPADERTTGFNRLPEQQRMESEPVVETVSATDLRASSRAKASQEKLAQEKLAREQIAQAAVSQPKVSPLREQSSSREALAKNSYGPVRQGETLYSIANELRPTGVTLSQTMAAILRTNPKAFAGNAENPSIGDELYIPPKIVMTVLSDTEAKSFLRYGSQAPQKKSKPAAAAIARAPARQPSRTRAVTKQPRPPVVIRPKPTNAVDSSLPIAQTFPLETAADRSGSTRYVTPKVTNLPSKARAPRNENPSISTFTNNGDPVVIPPANTLPPKAATTFQQPVEPRVVAASVKNVPTEKLPQEQYDPDANLGSSEAETAAERSAAAAQPSATTADNNAGLELRRAEIRQRAEEARKLAESARAEIARVKLRQAELVTERADELEAAALQLEKAKADKQALETLVAKPATEKTSQITKPVTEKVIGPVPEPVAPVTPTTELVIGADFLTAELTSLPRSKPVAMAASQQAGNAKAESVVSDDASLPAAVLAENAAAPDNDDADNNAVDDAGAGAKIPESGDAEKDAASQVTASPSQPINSDLATQAAGSSPAIATDKQEASSNESGTGWLTKVKNGGQQAVAAVSSSASAAASTMNGEPAELAPTDVNNYADPNFWANYFNRLKNGNIEAHNPILWAALLGLLLLWLLSRVARRKEKFTEPNDYGDLDGTAEGLAANEKSPASPLDASTATLVASKDPLGDANFHIDYGMHAQALDIVRAAKPAAKGELAQQLLLKEADILAAQGDNDALHMLSQQQSDNTELKAHIVALTTAAAAAKEKKEPSAETEGADEMAAAGTPSEPEVEPLVDDFDSLIADDDLLMDAAAEEAEGEDIAVAKPSEANNLVDFNLDDLDFPEPEVVAAATDANTDIDRSDDNSLEFDLDSLSAELDNLSVSSAAASSPKASDSRIENLQIDEGQPPKKGGVIDELEELTASLGGDDDFEDLDASFTADDGLDELAASLADDQATNLGDVQDIELDDDFTNDVNDSLDDEFLVEAISEPAKPAPAASADPAAEISFGDVLSTQLDLARAYSDMGDTTEARKLLETVIERGSQRQIAEANQLLKELG